jgi:gamma-glutamyl:cysteine ligase YbdK (ATP-grasp superfamily)
MGEDIATSQFTDEDFRRFDERLKAETEILEAMCKEGRIQDAEATGGFELEAWLIDDDCQPAPRNDEFLRVLDNELVVPELSQFNLEFNTPYRTLNGKALSEMETAVQEIWSEAAAVAREMGLKMVMIGILPTVEGKHLCQEVMSDAERYKAINDQIFRIRKGKPINLRIENEELLESEHMDVMLEAATTSFQIHLKVNQRQGADYYNASKIASAPIVAASANSPFLFGRNLWAETRIPLFEHAVSVGKWDYCERVTFGVRYIDESLCEVFVASRQRYPSILPRLFDTPPERLRHLRLHNGTIWRWNRPIIGFEPDGTPHFRIEHRVIPAGPTCVDGIANAAFYFGLVTALVKQMPRLKWDIPFSEARDNFYESARLGLEAEIHWGPKRIGKVSRIILDDLLPLAYEGLESLNFDDADISKYLGVIEARVKSGQTGATWQRAFVKKNGRDMCSLTKAYYERQETGVPVHEWSL